MTLCKFATLHGKSREEMWWLVLEAGMRSMGLSIFFSAKCDILVKGGKMMVSFVSTSQLVRHFQVSNAEQLTYGMCFKELDVRIRCWLALCDLDECSLHLLWLRTNGGHFLLS